MKEVIKHFRLKMILTESEEIGENTREGGNIKEENADVESEGTLFAKFDRANDKLPEVVQPEIVHPEVVQSEDVQPEVVQPEVVQPEVVDVSDDDEDDEMLGHSEAQEGVRQFLIA